MSNDNFIFDNTLKATSNGDTCTVSQGIQPYFRLDLTTAVTFWGVELLSRVENIHGNIFYNVTFVMKLFLVCIFIK